MRTRYFNKLKLRTQLLLALILAFATAAVLTTHALKRVESTESRQTIREEAKKLSHLVSNLSAPAVRQRDEKAINDSLELIATSYSKLLRTTFYDVNGEIIATYTNAPLAIVKTGVPDPETLENINSIVTTTSRIEFQKEHLGELVLVWDASWAETRVKQLLNNTYFMLFGLLTILGIVFAMIMNSIVLNPIEKIQYQMRIVQENRKIKPLKLDAAKELRNLADRANEFGSLMQFRIQRENELQDTANAKSDFLANMSHELRTPLNGVLGMLGLLETTSLSSTQREYLQTAASSGRSLLELINDILDFSKVEARKMEFESVDFDLHEILEQCCAAQAEPAHRKKLELVTLIDHELPKYLRGDPTRIGQILTNLISNAIKFTQKGHVAIRLHLLESPENYKIQFNVSDTGIGMNESAMSRIFDSFAQADESTTRKFGGTGLGLAICKQLAEAMGGAIGVNSKEGEGSTFWFELTLDHSIADTGDPSPGYELKGTKILAIDHVAISQEVIGNLLSLYQAQHVTAASTKQGIALLDRAKSEKTEFDFILFNSNTNNKSSAEFVETIKSDYPKYVDKLVKLQYITDIHAGDTNSTIPGIIKPLRISSFYERLTAILTGQEDVASLGSMSSENLSLIKSEPKAPVSDSTAIENAKCTILVAEDNPVNQMVAQGLLETMGFKVQCVDNGQEAIEHIQSNDCDLILMDCQMPVMDGYQATRSIREREDSLSSIPIIALTANAMQGDAQKCTDAGMDDYMSKPFDTEKLESMINRLIFEHRNPQMGKAA